MLIPWIVFVVVLGVALGTYWVLVLLPESREQSSLKMRLKAEKPARAASVELLKRVDAMSSIAVLNTALSRLERFSTPLRDGIYQGGLPITVGTLVLISSSTFFGVLLFIHAYVPVWWFALAVAAAAGYIPYWVVAAVRARRVRKFEDQFPEAVELIARAMRAGHAFSTGLKMVADEMPAPVGTEFKMLYERQNYGEQLPDALKTFSERVPSLDSRFFVTAVLTQREAGGNLSEVLDRLAEVMRDRSRVKREVRVRSAHGRVTAYVLAGMPPVLAVFLMVGNPEQFYLLIGDPLGMRLITAAGMLQAIGMLLVNKLVNIEY